MLAACQQTAMQKLGQRSWRVLHQCILKSVWDLLWHRKGKNSSIQCDSRGSLGKSQRNCRNFCCCCTTFIDLARADTYAYIHLTGIPYCNAARQCQAVCEQTNLFSNNQTCIRLYRIAAQIFVVGLSVLLAFVLFKAKITFVNLLIIVVVICICYVMGTHFVDIHSNAA